MYSKIIFTLKPSKINMYIPSVYVSVDHQSVLSIILISNLFVLNDSLNAAWTLLTLSCFCAQVLNNYCITYNNNIKQSCWVCYTSTICVEIYTSQMLEKLCCCVYRNYFARNVLKCLPTSRLVS